jgi:hypothetical protein
MVPAIHDSGHEYGVGMDESPPDTQPPPPSAQSTVAAISAALLEIVRILGRVEERLMHVEALVGVASPEYIDDDRQSVHLRTWDAVAQRWVYSPDPQ